MLVVAGSIGARMYDPGNCTEFGNTSLRSECSPETGCTSWMVVPAACDEGPAFGCTLSAQASEVQDAFDPAEPTFGWICTAAFGGCCNGALRCGWARTALVVSVCDVCVGCAGKTFSSGKSSGLADAAAWGCVWFFPCSAARFPFASERTVFLLRIHSRIKMCC